MLFGFTIQSINAMEKSINTLVISFCLFCLNRYNKDGLRVAPNSKFVGQFEEQSS